MKSGDKISFGQVIFIWNRVS